MQKISETVYGNTNRFNIRTCSLGESGEFINIWTDFSNGDLKG